METKVKPVFRRPACAPGRVLGAPSDTLPSKHPPRVLIPSASGTRSPGSRGPRETHQKLREVVLSWAAAPRCVESHGVWIRQGWPALCCARSWVQHRGEPCWTGWPVSLYEAGLSRWLWSLMFTRNSARRMGTPTLAIRLHCLVSATTYPCSGLVQGSAEGETPVTLRGACPGDTERLSEMAWLGTPECWPPSSSRSGA